MKFTEYEARVLTEKCMDAFYFCAGVLSEAQKDLANSFHEEEKKRCLKIISFQEKQLDLWRTLMRKINLMSESPL